MTLCSIGAKMQRDVTFRREHSCLGVRSLYGTSQRRLGEAAFRSVLSEDIEGDIE
jgi:hypothetical protein